MDGRLHNMYDRVSNRPLTVPMWGVAVTYQEAMDEAVASLQAYAAAYETWVLCYSGGKDSSAVVSFVVYAIENRLITPPKKLVVAYSDTQMEMPPLRITAGRLIDDVNSRGYEGVIVLPPIEKRFWVQILGRGLQPPKRSQRWCTEHLKARPILEVANRYPDALQITGVRLGESASRDSKIGVSCSKNDGECGQGWFQQSKNALAPLLSWRLCWVWRWIYDQRNPFPYLRDIESVYFADDLFDTRTGCIMCEIVQEDRTFLRLVRKPDWKSLAPLTQLADVYSEMRKPQYRLRRMEAYERKDGTFNNSRAGQLGPLTIEARQHFFTRVRELEQSARYTLIGEEEELAIREMWAGRVFPSHWDGTEPTGDESLPVGSYVDGEMLYQLPLPVNRVP